MMKRFVCGPLVFVCLLVTGTLCLTELFAQPLKPRTAPENASRFVSDVTIPDGTILQPGEKFTKTWRILNSGSAMWEGYQLFFSHGDQMSAAAFVEIPSTSARHDVEISVPMVAPKTPGYYQGNWGLRTVDGTQFGSGVWVSILVKGGLPVEIQGRVGARPILYLDVDGQEPVISAVYPDGTLRKRLVRTIGTGCLTCPGSASAVWSPDGRHFAFVALDYNGTDSVLYRQDLEGAAKEIIRIAGAVSNPAWSPDGEKIALLGGGKIHVVDLSSGADRTYSLEGFPESRGRSGAMFRVNKFRWSPAGRQILFSWGSALVLDTENGRIERISHHPVFPEWGTNGKGVYYVDLIFEDDDASKPKDWGGFYYHPLGQAEPVELADSFGLVTSLSVTKRDIGGASLWPGFLTLSPDGSTLAFLIRRGEKKVTDLYLYQIGKKARVDLGQPDQKIRIHDLAIAMEWAPTGKGMAGVGSAGAGAGIKVLDFESGSWTTLAIIAHDETVLAHYVVIGRKSISWTE